MVQEVPGQLLIDTRQALPELTYPTSTITAELVDGLTEAVIAPTAGERAATIRALVDHLVEAVVWWHGSSPDEDELASLSRLTRAADDHVQAMSQRPGAVRAPSGQ